MPAKRNLIANPPSEPPADVLDIVPVNPHERRFRKTSRRVCLIRRDQGSEATGFLVGPDLMLTTAHALRGTAGVFADPEEVTILFDQFMWDQRTGVRAFGASCGLRHIPFTRQPDVVASSIMIDAKSRREIPNESNELDYVLVRLDRPIGLEFLPFSYRIRGWNDCSRDKAGPIGEVFVVQHPLGGLQDFARGFIEKNHASHNFPTLLQYRTKTLNGSSGAPVYNNVNQVVAIHVGETSVNSQLAVSFQDVFRDLTKNKGVKLPPFPIEKDVMDSIFGTSDTEKARYPRGIEWGGDRLFDGVYDAKKVHGYGQRRRSPGRRRA